MNITVSCVIDEKGNVTEPKVIKATNEAFSEPVLEALKKWKFDQEIGAAIKTITDPARAAPAFAAPAAEIRRPLRHAASAKPATMEWND